MRVRIALTLGAAMIVSAAQAQDPIDPADWPRYARDLSGTRYSPLTDITPQNVDQLEQAWSFQLRPEGGAALLGGTVPIVIAGTMYLPLGNAVVALEAHSGKEIWRHPVTEGVVRRGVSWWPGDEAHPPRIFYNNGSVLVALDSATGQPVESFGDNGALKYGGTPYNYPPTVYRNTLVIGANTQEMPIGEPGNSRAFDAVTGKKLWEFSTVPQPGETGHETWLDDGWKGRSGNNMWIWYTTADPETNTLYMPIGGPSPNYYGGDRPGANLFGNSLVAVDADTGKLKWYFQTIHHDLWDWDLPPPPVLVDIQKDGKTIPALSQTGKNGLMYILNRETGEPVFGVEERPVAAADVPGEWYSPTQPFPVKPEQLSRGVWNRDDVVSASDTTPEHAQACRDLLASYGGTFYNAGSFTPFFLHEEGDKPFASINMPHNGGSNWGGSAADPAKGLVFVNTSEGGSIGWIEKRDPKGDYGRGTTNSNQLYDRGSLQGPGAYSSFSASYTEKDGRKVTLPCIKPPWGRLIAVDANTGEIAWASTLGITPELPEGKQKTGALNTFGGPMVTAGGLVFIGATGDQRFRAFDAATGKEVWTKTLDNSPQTVPISYRGKDGRQYIAVVAAGSGFGPPRRGPDGRPIHDEALIAFALPD
ncbi:PQQ-binding-like beta-propeller repeat protein [Altericroceibacterium xinjiangense]|uniref:outer membrane protein assembly factor BamB family protein n=1 Tax=Altericroceibacterium xinjiangense TaxID=762261 RepID=UPI000F7F1BD9|nr:PQQ-binding-like beta-propeller repeat protein [Altericroceibacterium xinjiangense]